MGGYAYDDCEGECRYAAYTTPVQTERRRTYWRGKFDFIWVPDYDDPTNTVGLSKHLLRHKHKSVTVKTYLATREDGQKVLELTFKGKDSEYEGKAKYDVVRKSKHHAFRVRENELPEHVKNAHEDHLRNEFPKTALEDAKSYVDEYIDVYDGKENAFVHIYK